MPTPETILHRIHFLMPDAKRANVPVWPPDVFCICAALLYLSGAYSQVVEDKPPHLQKTTSSEREKMIRRIGDQWRKGVRSGSLPPELQRWWELIFDHSNQPISHIYNDRECCEAILNLLASADASSADLGIERLSYRVKRRTDASEVFRDRADRDLAYQKQFDGEGATLCRRIHPSKARVLPKMHTAQNGLTVRSLSHNLAFISCPDVKVGWLSACTDVDERDLNLLVIPWPSKILPRQFVSSRECLGNRISNRSHGLFTYVPGPGPDVKFVRKLIRKAEKDFGHVDGIVFPELSMSQDEFDQLAKAFVNGKRFLMAGVGHRATGPRRCGKNYALWEMQLDIEPVSIRARFTQKKHHRWKLNKSQILQYGLAGTLHPLASWWEHISIGERSIAFATIRWWLCLSMLICEDLARPDPVSEILRSVGPNLIIALLSDGPQLVGRWPGRCPIPPPPRPARE